MSKQTAKFIGDLSWFSASKTKGRYSSPREALKAHLDYITRPSECVVSWNLKKEDWLRRADTLLEKSTRSRIASKIVFALPNDLSPSEGLALLREFLTSREIFFYKQRVDGKTKRVPVKLDNSDFGVAVHDSRGISGVRNLHAHVLFSPIHRGRKLDANKKSLSKLHSEWEEFLKSKGYSLRRSPVPEGHYGPSRLRYDREARASYAHLVRGKQLWRAAVEREQLRRVMEQAVETRGGDNLPTWEELLQEESTPTREEKTRERVSAKKSAFPKPQQRPSPKLVRKPTVQSRPSPKPKPIQLRVQMHSLVSPSVNSYITASLAPAPKTEADRELLKLLRELEHEVEQKRREEEARQRREAMMLEESLKRQRIYVSPEPDEDDWDRAPGM